MELIPGGADVEVTSTNVYDYVRKYAEFRLVKAADKCLQVKRNKNQQHQKIYKK